MNKKQKVILSLLKEIDEICRQNKIEYYLSPRLTLCAVEDKPFPKNPMFGVVLMKTADMERFRKAVDEDPREKRALESMKSHKWFSGFYLRYTNTDTLCLNLDNTRDYAFPGIGVSIFPLRTPVGRASANRSLSRDENAWTELCHINYAERNFKSRVNRTIMRLQCMINGRQRQAAHLYDRFVRAYQQPGADKYILKRRKQTTVFPADIFANSKRVTLEGVELQIPEKAEEYLTISYGNNYKAVTDPKYVTPIALAVSARVSYTQFWKEAGDYERYCKERMRNSRKLARSRRHKEYFNECWDYVEFCGERMNLGVSYEKKKDYIKNLYKNEDYMTLEKVFRPYFKMMQKSLQKNELFAEDEEILDIYIDVLEKTGKTVQREKIGMLI